MTRKKTLLALLAISFIVDRSQLPRPSHVEAASAGHSAIELNVERLDPTLDSLVAPGTKAVEIASGYQWTEGPLWLPSQQLVFADTRGNSINLWNPDKGVSIFMRPSGYKGTTPYGGPEPGSNGMTFDATGRLTVAGHAQRDVWRLESLSPVAPVTVLADSYQGKRLNSPNDIVYRSDGSLYFTDPTFGLRTQVAGDPDQALKVQGVYRLPGALKQKPGSAPARSSLQLLVSDLQEPNGLAFSPDEKYLYVDNSLPEMLWLRYTVKPDGSLTDRKVFFDAGPYEKHGAPDGMKVDSKGDIYSAGPGGVWIFSPAGKHLGTIRFSAPVGNVAWGGADFKTLYITASTAVYSMRVAVAGISPQPRRLP